MLMYLLKSFLCVGVCAVPVLLSVIRKSISTESSLTLHWSVPAQLHYTILQYQLRYCETVRMTRRSVLPLLNTLALTHLRS